MSNPRDWKWTAPDKHGITYPLFGTKCPDCGEEGYLSSPSYGPNDPPQYCCTRHGGFRTWRARTREAFSASADSLALSRSNAEQIAKANGAKDGEEAVSCANPDCNIQGPHTHLAAGCLFLGTDEQYRASLEPVRTITLAFLRRVAALLERVELNDSGPCPECRASMELHYHDCELAALRAELGAMLEGK